MRKRGENRENAGVPGKRNSRGILGKRPYTDNEKSSNKTGQRSKRVRPEIKGY